MTVMKDRLEIARNWLPRYTGMPLDQFGDYVLLTNFQYYHGAIRGEVQMQYLRRRAANAGGHQ